MSENIKIRGGHCGECKYYNALQSTTGDGPFWGRSWDGECKHPTRNGKNRKTPYKVYSLAACCFDAEDPDEYEKEEMKWDE